MHQFRELLRRLRDHDVAFVLIGGVAATLHGSPLTTMDVDVCIAMDDANLFKVHAAVQGIGPRFRMRPDQMPLWDDPQRLRGMRNLNLLTDLGQIDLLGEVAGVGSYEDALRQSVEIDLGGFTCRVLDLDALIAAKRAAGRSKDQLGVWHLEAVRKKRGPNAP